MILLAPLKTDAEVTINTHHEKGTILKQASSPRAYYVKTPNKVIRRNREHVISLNPGTPVKSPDVKTQATLVKIPEKKTELNILSRPRRTLKPSINALNNMPLS